jgi:transcription initiation factor TFIID subunit 8
MSADEYARTLARVAAGSLAEVAGFETCRESAVEILSDLLLHYLAEVSCGANSYAEIASRSDINVHDVLLSIEDLGTNVDEMKLYLGSISGVSSSWVLACM